jgi:hypothetical protein
MSCTRCGHIRGALDSDKKCHECGLTPAQWASAPIEHDEEEELATGEVEPPVAYTDTPHAPDPAELFATAPPGGSGRYEPNPELKVRR